MTIPNRAFVATATGTFADPAGNVGPTIVESWYISETAGSTGGATITDAYFASPSTLVAALVATSTGTVDAGTHSYKLTYVTAQGETEANTASNVVTTDSTHKQVTVSSIPAPPTGVTSRKLYRTAAGGSTYKLLATLLDPTITTYTDNSTDAQLGANAPSTNTTGATDSSSARCRSANGYGSDGAITRSGAAAVMSSSDTVGYRSGWSAVTDRTPSARRRSAP